MIRGFAAFEAKGPLKPFEYEPGPLGENQVEVDVQYCGICHWDLSMIDNEWGMSAYPLVVGHEAVGPISAVGSGVKHLKVGQVVGVGWFSGSCMTCHNCMDGDHNLCATGEATIIGRNGAFANKVRCAAPWAVPLPAGLDVAKAGPLFCGGITVFNPIVQFDIHPTDHVGVIGIGGLGHMALQFLSKWGCHVTAFTSSDSKKAEALSMGAHATINTRDDSALAKAKGSMNFIISTVNVTLNWNAILDILAPKGRLHFVGAVGEPVPVPIFPMLLGQKSLSGSPLGSPSTTAVMLEFAARHKIAPITQNFPLSKVNDALDHLRSGKARYRVVLVNDLK